MSSLDNLDHNAAIIQAMRENDLDAMFRSQIEHYLTLPDDSWAQCCSSVCDPCVLKLARTVARIRELTGGS